MGGGESNAPPLHYGAQWGRTDPAPAPLSLLPHRHRFLAGLVQGGELGVLAGELGDEVFHQAHDLLFGGALARGKDQLLYGGLEVAGVRAGAHGGDFDLGVVGFLVVLVFVEQLLVELFAGAQAGMDDFDVLAGGQAGHLDHAAGEVDDFDGLAHVEDVDLAAFAHGAGFEHELAGLGDGHEKAAHFGVGDGDGLPPLYLLAENRDDGAVGAEHVAEAGGDEAGGVARLVVEGLHVDLGDALRGAHDVAGVDDFVGGDHDEFVGLVLGGKVGDVFGAQHIGFDGFFRELLHDGHVLVGGSVENVVGLVGLEQQLHAVVVAYVAQDRQEGAVLDFLLQGKVDVGHGGLGDIDADDLPGLVFEQLADDLPADGARAAGDHDAAAAYRGTDGLVVELYGRAVEQVFEADVPQLAEIELVVDPGFGGGHLHDLDVVLQAFVDEGHPAVFGELPDGDDGDLDVVALDDFLKVAFGVEHPDAVQKTAVDGHVVVEERHDAVVVGDILPQHVVQQRPHFARPEYHRIEVGALGPRTQVVHEQADTDPHAVGNAEQQDVVD